MAGYVGIYRDMVGKYVHFTRLSSILMRWSKEHMNNKTDGKKIDKLEHLHEKVRASFFLLSKTFKPLKVPLN